MFIEVYVYDQPATSIISFHLDAIAAFFPATEHMERKNPNTDTFLVMKATGEVIESPENYDDFVKRLQKINMISCLKGEDILRFEEMGEELNKENVEE